MRQGGWDPATTTLYCFTTLADVKGQIRRMVDGMPKVLVIFASPVAARAARDATSTLPIVFADVPDPVKNGLVKSFANPGSNLTGVSNKLIGIGARR